MESKQKSGMGGGRIVTLTGWTHRLHTNTRKCVSVIHIAEIRTENITVGEWGVGGTYRLKTTSRRSRRSVESQENATKIVSFLKDVPEIHK